LLNGVVIIHNILMRDGLNGIFLNLKKAPKGFRLSLVRHKGGSEW